MKLSRIYTGFTHALQAVLMNLLPLYVPSTHKRMGTKIQLKDDGTPVTDLDNYALEQLRAVINNWYPKDCTIGEEDKKSSVEMEKILANQEQYQWTIDGLDGTWHFSRGTNSYGAMISRRRGNQILYAAIFRPVDMILRGDGFFVAEQGRGAWEYCGDHNIYHQLHTAPFGALERMTVMLEGSSKAFFQEPIASLGAKVATRASLSSCIAATTVARGDATALVTRGNKPWDTWPAILMISEARGIVTDYQGKPIVPENCGDIVAAANQEDHATIVKLLNPEKGRV